MRVRLLLTSCLAAAFFGAAAFVYVAFVRVPEPIGRYVMEGDRSVFLDFRANGTVHTNMWPPYGEADLRFVVLSDGEMEIYGPPAGSEKEKKKKETWDFFYRGSEGWWKQDIIVVSQVGNRAQPTSFRKEG